MKCPSCDSTESKVIDSRPTKNNLGIRRRRECRICQSRFTTYESETGSLLQVVLNQHANSSTVLHGIKSTLLFTMKTLDVLSREMKALAQKAELFEQPQLSYDRADKDRDANGHKTNIPLTEKIMEVIGRYEKGINIPELKNATGFDDKKIRNLLYRASIDGKIKKIQRGVYAKK